MESKGKYFFWVVNCNVIFTSLHTSVRKDWYFDSGGSMHVTGEKNFLTDLKSCASKHIFMMMVLKNYNYCQRKTPIS